jgi:hypothetical protein
MPLAQRKSGLVFSVTGRKSKPKSDSKTMDLFGVDA